MFDTLLSWMQDAIVWVLDALRTFAEYTIGTAYQWIATNVIPAVKDMMPAEWEDYLSTVPWESVQGIIMEVAWVLPVWEAMTIVVLAYNIAGGIRLVRWVLAMIPTIGG